MNFNISALIPDPIKNFLAGSATYITGALTTLVSFLVMAGVDMSAIVPQVTLENAPQLFIVGLTAIFIRRGVTNEVKKIQ